MTTKTTTTKAPAEALPRRRAKRDAAHALEAAMALLAHEIRTPLNGILAFSELLAAADLGQREREWAAAIKSAAVHLDLHTTLIVDGVKARSTKLVLRNEPFRPRGLADAMAAMLAARAAAKGLTARIEIASDLPDALQGDPVRLRAVIENLVDNAVKFTQSGEVALAVRAEPAAKGRVRLVFALTDSGIGLSAAEIRRLFRPFVQANRGVARRYGGTGLGLALAQRIAKVMGGKLAVQSARGHGSTFRLEVTLERAREARPGSRNEASGEQSVSRHKELRVLCAEDNPYGRVVLNTILANLGHRVDFVGAGEDAVQALGQIPYDLVLMDLNLPRLDGIEATRRIRASNHAGAAVPIIGISGASRENAARKAGMDDYLTKPVTPAALAQAIARITAPAVIPGAGEAREPGIHKPSFRKNRPGI